MSMPSSSELVATTAGSRPDLSASSICLRSSLETLPWWARATTGAAPPAAPDWAMISAGSRGAPPARRRCRPDRRRPAVERRGAPCLSGQLVEAGTEALGARGGSW